jgi:toxin ParE1/3/4
VTNKQIEFLPSAWEDLESIADFHLNEVGPASAEKITNQILDAIELLQAFPYSGAIHPDAELAYREYRKLVLSKTYVAIYRVVDDIIFIYRIVNGATDYPRLLK